MYNSLAFVVVAIQQHAKAVSDLRWLVAQFYGSSNNLYVEPLSWLESVKRVEREFNGVVYYERAEIRLLEHLM